MHSKEQDHGLITDQAKYLPVHFKKERNQNRGPTGRDPVDPTDPTKSRRNPYYHDTKVLMRL